MRTNAAWWGRLPLALALLAAGAVTSERWPAVLGGPGHDAGLAWAQGDDDDDSGGDAEADGDGDGGGAVAAGDEDDEVEDGQPPVTSGGLFTRGTYPISELLRPLIMTRGMTEVAAGVGFDVSATTAFDSYGIDLQGRYGVLDNVELQAGFTSTYNVNQFDAYVGFEGALSYDLVDFRTILDIRRDFATQADGTITSGDTSARLAFGFPFRYVAKPQIAIVALDTLFDLDLSFSDKPDLIPSLGVSTNPIPAVSLVVEAQMRIAKFNTDAGSLQIPLSAKLQFSPNNRFDIGAKFTFLNVKGAGLPTSVPDSAPGAGDLGRFDNRFLTFYAQARF